MSGALPFTRIQHEQPTSPEQRAEVLENPGFGQFFTDHMVTIRWSQDEGWHDARVEPYGSLTLEPATTVLHYGQAIFEGLKAYRQPDRSVAAFRPESNARRFHVAGVLMLPVLVAAMAAGGATRSGAPEAVAGIDPVVLDAYARAAAALADECPGLTWAVLAGIGSVESDHATGHDIDATGRITPPIIGPRLDGSGAGGNTTPHPDTDGGRWDQDTAYDHAVGLTQHLPTTWAERGRDATGDGVADPHNAYDAALTTAAGLCQSDTGGGVDLSDRDQLRDALFAYNHSDAYVDEVMTKIDRYTALGQTVTVDGGAGSEAGRAAAEWALGQVGKPYIWGGTGPAGFDCSGLVMRAWQEAGVDIPRVTTDQYRIGTPVPRDRLQPGDLLFYDTGGPGAPPAHVTMYVGDGKMVNAPSTGKNIRVDPVASDYYSPLLMGTRRP